MRVESYCNTHDVIRVEVWVRDRIDFFKSFSSISEKNLEWCIFNNGEMSTDKPCDGIDVRLFGLTRHEVEGSLIPLYSFLETLVASVGSVHGFGDVCP